MNLKLLNIGIILSSIVWVGCSSVHSEKYLIPELSDRTKSELCIDKILHCIQYDSFVLYSRNLESDESNIVIDQCKHKELRALIDKAICSGELTIERKDHSQHANDQSLHVHLLPYTYDGKNIQLKLPQFASKKIYCISMDLELLEEIKRLSFAL